MKSLTVGLLFLGSNTVFDTFYFSSISLDWATLINTCVSMPIRRSLSHSHLIIFSFIRSDPGCFPFLILLMALFTSSCVNFLQIILSFFSITIFPFKAFVCSITLSGKGRELNSKIHLQSCSSISQFNQ